MVAALLIDEDTSRIQANHDINRSDVKRTKLKTLILKAFSLPLVSLFLLTLDYTKGQTA
jgi:hypothetical protein